MKFTLLARLLVLFAVGTPAVGSAALVGYWNFDNTTTPGADTSGNNYNLTLSSVSTVSTGKRGRAVSFNGTSSYAVGNLTTLPTGNSPYTMAAWFKPTATGTRGIIGWGNFGQNRQCNALRLNATNGLTNYWWGADLSVTPTVNYSDGLWHHVVAVYDGTTRAIYLDGEIVGQDTPGVNGATNSGFRIGSTNFGEFYKGQLDEVALWNNALTSAEILGLATGGAPVGGPRATTFTATPNPAYEGQSVQLAWNVDTSTINGTYSYQLKSGATVLATGTTPAGNFTVTVPDLAGTPQNLTYVLRAIETGGGNIANSFGVTVAADPGRPVATAQAFLATAGVTPLPITLAGQDINGGSITYAIATPPTKGTLTGSPPAVIYTANEGASGPDSFTFRVNDGKYDSLPATVSLTINAPPTAPTAIVLDTTFVNEATVSGGFVASISAIDPNPGDVQTFALVSGAGDTDNAKFTVFGHLLLAAQSFTGHAGEVVSLRLRTTDSAGFTFEQVFALAVAVPQRGVTINEIHCNGVDNTIANEFVELYNSATVPFDLAGWRMSGGVDYTFPAGTTMAPGTYLIVAASPPTILSKFSKTALGPWVGSLSSEGETLRLRDQSDAIVDEVDYKIGFPWPVAAGGDGASMEKINPLLDGSLGASWRSSTIPASTATVDVATPGAINLKYVANAPPAIRSVGHSPQQPTSQQPIRFTAKVTDPDGVASVSLSYQLVTPGNYLPRYLSNVPANNNIAVEARALNPNFELAANWTTVPMTDSGTLGDAQVGDNEWTAVLLPLPHRTLVRYRITVTDTGGRSVRVPYADDASANFGCFIYDGVPAYGSTAATALTSLPTYHLLTKASDWTDCMAYDATKQLNQGLESRFYYNWNGTFVYNGVVYDHITYRTRGGNGRYTGAGKRSMRFKFHRGSYLEARDQDGKLYPTKWQTLTIAKGIENHGTLTFSLNEWLNFRMWNAYGAPAPFCHFVHWRNITTAAEQSDAFHGDFQGFYFAQEDYDARFFEAHNLQKGNLYKLLNQTNAPLAQQRYQAATGAKNGVDHDWIETNLTGATPPADVAANVNLEQYNKYHAICQAVRHYDYWPDANKNMTYYFEPVYTPQNGNRGKLWIMPFDTDASWGPNWNNGEDVVYNALFATSGGGGDSLTNPTLWPGYFNAVREVRDLLFQPDQINPLVDEVAGIVAPIVPADYARWKTAPADVGSYSGIGGVGMTSLASLAQDAKNFAFTGGSWAGGSVGTGGRAAFLDTLQASQSEGTKIPVTPTITYVGGGGFPLNDLRFRTVSFDDPQGAATFGSVQWRMAEITDAAAPAYVPGERLKLEITPSYLSAEFTTFATDFRFPAAACQPGHTYRARVRVKDNTGRASHWSAPVQFTATAANLAVYQQSLVLSEIMYHPVAATIAEEALGWSDSDFEYVEVRNVGSVPVDLSDVRFTKGIDFDFANAQTIAPGATLLIVRNVAALTSRYGSGKPIGGVWQPGALSNGGETIKLSYGAGEEIASVTYNDKAPWPVQADGLGSSLVRILPENLLLDPNLGTSWRASAQPGGTPGTDDRQSYAQWAAANAISGAPLDDPDQDGVVNLLEFALAADAAAGNNIPVIESSLTGDPAVPNDPASYLTISFLRRDLPADIHCAAAFSQNLTTWNVPAVFVSAELQPDGTIRETWRSSLPQSTIGKIFGRVQVTTGN